MNGTVKPCNSMMVIDVAKQFVSFLSCLEGELSFFVFRNIELMLYLNWISDFFTVIYKFPKIVSIIVIKKQQSFNQF